MAHLYVHRKDTGITIHTSFFHSIPEAFELAPSKTAWCEYPSYERPYQAGSSITWPIFILAVMVPQEGSTWYQPVYCLKVGISSTGNTRCNPLFPWRPAILFSDADLPFLCDVSSNRHVDTWLHHLRLYGVKILTSRTTPSPPWGTRRDVIPHFRDSSPKTWKGDVLQHGFFTLRRYLPTRISPS